MKCIILLIAIIALNAIDRSQAGDVVRSVHVVKAGSKSAHQGLKELSGARLTELNDASGNMVEQSKSYGGSTHKRRAHRRSFSNSDSVGKYVHNHGASRHRHHHAGSGYGGWKHGHHAGWKHGRHGGWKHGHGGRYWDGNRGWNGEHGYGWNHRRHAGYGNDWTKGDRFYAGDYDGDSDIYGAGRRWGGRHHGWGGRRHHGWGDRRHHGWGGPHYYSNEQEHGSGSSNGFHVQHSKANSVMDESIDDAKTSHAGSFRAKKYHHNMKHYKRENSKRISNAGTHARSKSVSHADKVIGHGHHLHHGHHGVAY